LGIQKNRKRYEKCKIWGIEFFMVGCLRVCDSGLFDCDGKDITRSVDVVAGLGLIELRYFHLCDGCAL
jgi:hypothetical protein